MMYKCAIPKDIRVSEYTLKVGLYKSVNGSKDVVHTPFRYFIHSLMPFLKNFFTPLTSICFEFDLVVNIFIC